VTNPYGPQQPYGQPGQPQPGYGPQQFGGGQPVIVPGARSYGTGAPPPYAVPVNIHEISNYKAWAIITVFLSLGTGILAIIRSNEVDDYKARGNAVLAKEASDSVKTLCLFAAIPAAIAWIAIIVGIIIAVSS